MPDSPPAACSSKYLCPAQLADHGVRTETDVRSKLLVSRNVQDLKKTIFIPLPKLFPCVLDLDAPNRGDESPLHVLALALAHVGCREQSRPGKGFGQPAQILGPDGQLKLAAVCHCCTRSRFHGRAGGLGEREWAVPGPRPSIVER